MSARTQDGRSVPVLNLIDEYTRECLLISVKRRWTSAKANRGSGQRDGNTRNSAALSLRQRA
jgi:hypothetical protein